MKKAIQIVYGISAIIYLLLIPLTILLCRYWINNAMENIKGDSVGAAVGGVFAGIIICAVFFALTFIICLAHFISLLVATIGFFKVKKAENKKSVKKIAIVSIIFIGNIIPGIMILKTNENEFLKSNHELIEQDSKTEE